MTPTPKVRNPGGHNWGFQRAAADGLCRAYAELSGTIEDLVRVDRFSYRSSNSGMRSISVDHRPMTSR